MDRHANLNKRTLVEKNEGKTNIYNASSGRTRSINQNREANNEHYWSNAFELTTGS